MRRARTSRELAVGPDPRALRRGEEKKRNKETSSNFRVEIFELWGHARTSREVAELVLAPDLRALCRWAPINILIWHLVFVLLPRHIHVL